ncbi:MAG: efflux RND transporter periplasmic adaptor subunit [Bacteroidales bacterium]|jgi:cobalt-zinc-cadmium efflux system membrane fusion protein
MRINRIFSFVLIITAFTLICSCSNHQNVSTNTDTSRYCIPDSLIKQITYDTVISRPVIQELNLIGNVTYNQDKVVKLFPMVSGNVVEVKVTLGDFVHKGDILAVVKSGEIAGAENDVITAQANLAVSERNQSATESLYKSGIASEKDYLASVKETEKARSELNRVNTVLSIYGGSQSDYIIKSPISGCIVEKFINPGMQIRPDNSNNLFTISDLGMVWILANVYESDIASIKIGEKAVVTSISYPDKRFIGTIDKIYNVLDPDNKTMKVRIQLDNKENLLKPEMFANVIVQQVQDSSMLAVPTKSIVFDQNKNWVLLYHNKCDVQIKQVDIVKFTNLFTYIRSGVKPGDMVITNMQLLIYNALTE